jgi:hypothetical protein
VTVHMVNLYCVLEPSSFIPGAALSVVVPAKAGTHTPCPIRFARPALIASLGIMGPRLRGDDRWRGARLYCEGVVHAL